MSRMNRAGILLFALAAACGAWAQLTSPGAPELRVQAVTETDAATVGQPLRVLLDCTLPEGWHVNAHTPLEDFLIPTEVSIAPAPAVRAFQVVYPSAKKIKLSFSDTEMAVYDAQFRIGIVVTWAEGVAPGTYSLSATLRYQACNDKTCMPPKTQSIDIPVRIAEAGTAGAPQKPEWFTGFPWGEAAATQAASSAPPPETTPKPGPPQTSVASFQELAGGFEVAGKSFGYQSASAFLRFLDRAEGKAPADGEGFAGQGVWVVVLLVLAGGLALNLTPCVLPLIPINIAIIGAGARAGSKRRGAALGGVYGLGIAAVYGALGLVVVLGVSAAFGTINASPWFNAGIAALFVVLGLAMFDLIYIDFTKYQAKVSLRSNETGSFLVAFAMGGLSALLAGACVAPVVIYTLVYAQDLYSQGQRAALLLPFLLGVGMALPWPIAGAGLSMLPKPGAWMNTIKHVFGIFILVFAAYYAYEAYGLFRVTASPPKEKVQATGPQEWGVQLEEGLRQAKAENKPVLIDFWATWCKNCLVMEKTTLRDPGVLDRTAGYVKIKFDATDLNASPQKDIAAYYEVKGLPTYVVLRPKNK